MEDMDSKLNAMLNDPAAMARIIQMAQQLSGGAAQASPPPPPPPHGAPPPPAGGGFDPMLLARFLPLLAVQQPDDTASLCAASVSEGGKAAQGGAGRQAGASDLHWQTVSDGGRA